MSYLYTSYSDTNKRNLERSRSPATPTGQTFNIENGLGYTLQQTNTERYQYFGMTEAAAFACSDAINALSTTTITYAATAARQGNSRLWNVNVSKVSIVISLHTITTTTTTTA